MQLKIVTKLDWPSFRYIATTIQTSLKPHHKCTLYRWMEVRPGGKILFIGTVDKTAFSFLQTLAPSSEIVWYATTEGLSRLDDGKTIGQSIKIIAVSNFVKEMLQQIGIPVAGVLHHGIDMSNRRVDMSLYRKMRNKLKGRSVVLTVSANHSRKALNRLLTAYQIVSEQYPDTYLIVHSQRTGHYDLRKQLKQVNSQNVWLTNQFGQMTRPQLNALYKLCAVYVQPSLSEGFGLPMLEAFRFNKGVIAVDAPPFNEIIRNGKTGLLFPSKEVAWHDDFKHSINFKLHEYASKDLANSIAKYLFDGNIKSRIESDIESEKWQWDARKLYPELLTYFN